MQEPNQQTKPKYSEEDYKSVFKGVRPEHMSQEDFKWLRKTAGMITKDHLRGKFIHISNATIVENAEGKPEVVYLKKGITYRDKRVEPKVEPAE